MVDEAFYSANANVSRFIVPFYLNPKFEKKHKMLFSGDEWERTKLNPIYLTEHIRQSFSDSID